MPYQRRDDPTPPIASLAAQYEAYPYPAARPAGRGEAPDRRQPEPPAGGRPLDLRRRAARPPRRCTRWWRAAARATARSCWPSTWPGRGRPGARHLARPLGRRAADRGGAGGGAEAGQHPLRRGLDPRPAGSRPRPLRLRRLLRRAAPPARPGGGAARRCCRCWRPGGGMGLMVYAPHGRTGVYMLQDALRLLAPPEEAPAGARGRREARCGSTRRRPPG